MEREFLDKHMSTLIPGKTQPNPENIIIYIVSLEQSEEWKITREIIRSYYVYL